MKHVKHFLIVVVAVAGAVASAQFAPSQQPWMFITSQDIEKFPSKEQPVIQKIAGDLHHLHGNGSDIEGPVFVINRSMSGIMPPRNDSDPPKVIIDTPGTQIVLAHIFAEHTDGDAEEITITPDIKRRLNASGCGENHEWNFFISGGKLMGVGPVCQSFQPGGPLHVTVFYRQ